jgi:hypothetical protein
VQRLQPNSHLVNGRVPLRSAAQKVRYRVGSTLERVAGDILCELVKAKFCWPRNANNIVFGKRKKKPSRRLDEQGRDSLFSP